MNSPIRILLSLSLLLSAGCSHGDTKPAATAKITEMQVSGENETNSPEAQAKPYVVLVSIDGFRWDFLNQFDPPALTSIHREGAAAQGLIPIYPSKTFPNHYSIVTGLYAKNHGIVSNEFFDPKRKAIFSLPDRQAVQDGSWYGGTPIWNEARKHGMLSASYFWIGSDAEISGMRPNYYYVYDETVPQEARVAQVVRWLELPAERRPHLITLYFGEVDRAAHDHGTKSPELAEAIRKVDQSISELRRGLDKTGLPINLILVSDHGHLDVEPAKTLAIDASPETEKLLAKFQILGVGPQMILYLKEGEDRKTIEETRRVLSQQAKNYRVLTAKELKRLNYDGNPRTGDLVVDPDPGYLIGTKNRMPKARGSNHGWDASRSKEMQGVLFAVGPSFKPGARVPAFENIHVHALVNEILSMKPTGTVDSKRRVILPLLKSGDSGK